MYVYSGIRKELRIPEKLFNRYGRLAFDDILSVREFLHGFNKGRDEGSRIYAGEMKASSLLQDVYAYILEKYSEETSSDPYKKAAGFLEKQLGRELIKSFSKSLENYAPGMPAEDVIPHSIVLHVANENPANKKTKLFFDKNYLKPKGLFEKTNRELEGFFKDMPPFGSQKQDIITFLKTPGLISPDSLDDQLDYILRNWKHLLPEHMVSEMLKGRDILKEEQTSRKAAGGAPPAIVPEYRAGGEGPDKQEGTEEGYYDEYGNFTPDTHWMPRVVIIARNTHVWLDQLSKKYKREITRLDQIPDEELDILRERNFNGLWLIGVWERSPASKKIKNRMGNPDAISSAYALYDYEIAEDLGGDQAYDNLNQRAMQRGIRLASDMVPNHTGVYSKWVIERPDYFIQTHRPPFPGYSFTGENLSDHPSIEIRIEDGYYDRSDAAVVFERIDRTSNEVRYIYHGNDGTMMPWNDTAQLDMIKAEVREAVMQKIFDVARKFSIIRFDAAMTLAKKHFARLWYPQPGKGGDIPSRSEYSIPKKEFDRLFPVEFWREVVDRINAEMPETLLLAEAFWLMEGYFVRTLGMHRVYNSAFMHMLKNEENEKYRDLITNTLEFEPEILKRYVNFMSNPDEETAISQFGSGDKYFGVCLLMNTLPGLPMYAHGQVEGLAEKYGMEYKKAYHAEEEKQWLVERHQREIFPLAGKRYLFSEVRHFNLYDYHSPDGTINENVFAFSNRHGIEKAVVFFNNKYDSTEGSVHMSVPRLKDGSKQPVRESLANELEADPGASFYYKAFEQISGMEYLFRGEDIHREGINIPLRGFEYRAFLGFQQLYDHDGSLYSLYTEIRGRGVKSINDELKLKKLRHIHSAFEAFLEHRLGGKLIESILHPAEVELELSKTEPLQQALAEFTHLVSRHENTGYAFGKLPALFRSYTKSLKSITGSYGAKIRLNNAAMQTALPIDPEDLFVTSGQNARRENAVIMLAYMAVSSCAGCGPQVKPSDLFNRFELGWPLEAVLKRSGFSSEDAAKDVRLLRIMLKLFEKDEKRDGIEKMIPLSDRELLDFIGANEYEGIWYYSREGFELLLKWIFSVSALELFRKKDANSKKLKQLAGNITEVARMSENASYRLEKLRKMLDNASPGSNNKQIR